MLSPADPAVEGVTGESAPPGHTRATAQEVRAVLESLGHDGRARILAAVARRFGDLDLAEDVIQDAFAQALRTWPASGIPEVPEAWLTTAARRKGIDVVRRHQALSRKLPRLRVQQQSAAPPSDLSDPADAFEDGISDVVDDDRLGLFFACAHPLLSVEDRVALTLRFLAGLNTAEVAYGLLVPVATMQQRLVRAKRRIRTLGISFDPPAREALTDRVAGVQRVIYLLYTEGFTRSRGEEHIRDDLTAEAIRLARTLHELIPGSAEATGLLALLVLTEARRPARTDDAGRPVPLADQDRTLWDTELIRQGAALAEEAASSPGAGAYSIQAAIAAVHAEARSFESTDWAQIAVLYGLLAGYGPSPVVRLGRAVALGRARGAKAGLVYLDQLANDAALDRFRPFHIARAVTCQELGDAEGAAAAYRRALQLPGNRAEDEFLAEALAGVRPAAPARPSGPME